ncbi:MAG: DUF72 domain-containing protein [Pseudomonadota bacterium]
MDQPLYHLGLPAWAFPGWKDKYFEDRPSRLASYARVFNTVEGNTTFYRVPDSDSVARWAAALQDSDFRFCFKLPREVTHDGRPNHAILGRFLEAIRPLRKHVGPLLVQFPATVAPQDLRRFTSVFEQVADAYRMVIEIRHPAFFEDAGALEPWLSKYGAGRVAFDSRPLFEGDLDHPEVREARHEKPNVPVVDTVYNDLTMIRLILHPDLSTNGPYQAFWVDRVAERLEQGVATYMMIHCPNNLHCPALAQQFHDALNARMGGQLPPLPAWPVPQQQGLL